MRACAMASRTFTQLILLVVLLIIYVFLTLNNNALSCLESASSFISVAVASSLGIAGLLSLCLLKVNDGLSSLLCLQRSSLCLAACHRTELSTPDKILEVLTRSKQYVHTLDVLRREFLQTLGALTAETYAKRAQLTKLNLVAVEQLLHKTLTHVADNTLHGTAAVHTIVVGNVLGELLQTPNL